MDAMNVVLIATVVLTKVHELTPSAATLTQQHP
jgi:hypothetical protein